VPPIRATVAFAAQESRVTSVGETAKAVVLGVADAGKLNTFTVFVPEFASTIAIDAGVRGSVSGVH